MQERPHTIMTILFFATLSVPVVLVIMLLSASLLTTRNLGSYTVILIGTWRVDLLLYLLKVSMRLGVLTLFQVSLSYHSQASLHKLIKCYSCLGQPLHVVQCSARRRQIIFSLSSRSGSFCPPRSAYYHSRVLHFNYIINLV